MKNTNKQVAKNNNLGEGVTETQIRSLSKFDENCIEVLRCLVPDQSMKLSGTGDYGEWESKCIQVDELAITTISKNGETIVKIVYDYDSSTEQEFWVVN